MNTKKDMLELCDENEEEHDPQWRPFLWLALAVITVQVVAGSIMYVSLPDGQRGTFGDMFGAVNTLFSGLAFAGVIYAIFLQQHELRLQRRELRYTRAEMKRSAEAQVKSSEEQAKQTTEIIKQSKEQAKQTTEIVKQNAAFSQQIEQQGHQNESFVIATRLSAVLALMEIHERKRKSLIPMPESFASKELSRRYREQAVELLRELETRSSDRLSQPTADEIDSLLSMIR